MPRVYLSELGKCEPNYPADFCKGCWPPDVVLCADIAGIGHGSAKASIDDAMPNGHDHPPYDGEDYQCEDCGAELTDLDD